MFKKPYIPVIILLLFAAFFRIFRLATTPDSLHLDEIVNVYVGRFILQNGVDLYGNHWPLFYFDKFGDFPPVIPMYIQALGTYIGGVNDFGSRIMTALLSTSMVIPLYYIADYIFQNKKTAFFIGIVFAVLPWQINFARTSAEGMIALAFYLYGLLLIFQTFRTKKIIYALLSLPLFLLTFFIYPSFRIITPLTFIPLPFFFIKKPDRTLLIFFVASTLLFFTVTAGILHSDWGKGRLNQVSIFNIVSGVTIRIDQLIFDDHNGPLIARIFHNKAIGYPREFLSQYFSYFSGSFLFIRGGGELTHKIPDNGEAYLTLLILAFLPAFDYFKKRNQKVKTPFYYYLTYLLLIAPIPAALTVIAVPNPHRAILMSAMLLFVAAYGFNTLTEIKWKKFPVYLLVYVFLAFETIYFMYFYFNHVSYAQFLGNNERIRDAMQYVVQHKDEYKEVYLPGKVDYISEYYLFYKNDFNKNLAGKFGHGVRIDQVENVHFIDSNCGSDGLQDPKNQNKKILVVDKEDCKHEGVAIRTLEQYHTSFGNVAFTVAEQAF